MKNPWRSGRGSRGIPVKDIEEVAKEFTSHGRKASIDIHRGVSQHTNGFYNVLAYYNLALLIGNYDYRGGLISLSTFNTTGGKERQPFHFGRLHPQKVSGFGISNIRHDVRYEDTTLFRGLSGQAELVAPGLRRLPGNHPFHGGCLSLSG